MDGARFDREYFERDFELQPVLESLAELARSERARSKPITLMVPANVTLSPNPGRQFQRAIENLLRNALRYTRTNASSSTCRPTPPALSSRSAMMGPVFRASNGQYVFEPFVRIDCPTFSRASRPRVGPGDSPSGSSRRTAAWWRSPTRSRGRRLRADNAGHPVMALSSVTSRPTAGERLASD